MRRIELLAPAPNLEILKLASNYDADAFYFGMEEFNLRINSGNFSLSDAKAGVALLHKAGKKAYLTLNSYPLQGQLQKLEELADSIKEIPFDAVIVADLGVLRIVRRKMPDIAIHISTQANIVNSEAIKFLMDFGVTRIILARELNVETIKGIRDAVKDIELEAFCHGAMCMAISGRCLLSYYFTNRASNQGDCPQVCRWDFALMEKTRPGRNWELYEDGGYTHFLNSKDLYTLDILDRLIAAGIDAIKIEGRNKGYLYLSAVIAAYSAGINAVSSDKPIPEYAFDLLRITKNRSFTHGFYIKGEENNSINYKRSTEPNDAVFLGFIDDAGAFQAKNKLSIGQKIMFFDKTGEIKSDIVKNVSGNLGYTRPADVYEISLEKNGGLKPWTIVFGKQPSRSSIS